MNDSIKTVRVRIEGVTPLLVHRFGDQAEMSKSTRKIEATNTDPREEAKRAAYIAGDGTYYFSAFAVPRAMAASGANHKMRGTRKTLRFVVPSAVRVNTDTITILSGDGPAKLFEVDARPVTIPATKGRVMRYRPRFNQWAAEFEVEIDESQVSIETAHQLLAEAGRSIGIGDFRPEKSGPFGQFRVVRFEQEVG